MHFQLLKSLFNGQAAQFCHVALDTAIKIATAHRFVTIGTCPTNSSLIEPQNAANQCVTLLNV